MTATHGFETREAIERLTRAHSLSVEAQDAVSQLVGELVEQGVRNGVIARRYGLSAKVQRDVEQMVRELVGDERRSAVRPLRPDIPTELVQEWVARSAGMSVQTMLAPRRDQRRVRTRQVAMYLVRMLSGETKSYPKIAREFGKKDHTTAMWACDAIRTLCARDATFHDYVEGLATSIQQAYNELVSGVKTSGAVPASLQRAS